MKLEELKSQSDLNTEEKKDFASVQKEISLLEKQFTKLTNDLKQQSKCDSKQSFKKFFESKGFTISGSDSSPIAEYNNLKCVLQYPTSSETSLGLPGYYLVWVKINDTSGKIDTIKEFRANLTFSSDCSNFRMQPPRDIASAEQYYQCLKSNIEELQPDAYSYRFLYEHEGEKITGKDLFHLLEQMDELGVF